MPSYVFSVNKVEVHNGRSRGQHNDSDWLSLFLKINDKVQTAGPGPFNIGPNIHGGDVHTGPWMIGPVEINDTDNVSLTYTVTNLSHDDSSEQGVVAFKIQSAVVGAIAGAAIGGPIGAVVGTLIAGLGELFGWIVDKSNPNCNGAVVHDTFEYPPGMLMRQATPHIVSNDYTEATPSECGNPPQTTVIYSIIDATSVRQSMMIRGIDPGQGIQHIRPTVTSLRAFMKV